MILRLIRLHLQRLSQNHLDIYRKKDPEMAKKYIDIIPKGRGAYEEEIADAVWYLATEEASFITGQVISVNGGSQQCYKYSCKIIEWKGGEK